MSMILEALRRADRERQGPASTPPNLTTVHYPPPAPGRRRHRRLIGGLLLLLAGIGLGVALAYWQWSGVGAAAEPQPSTPETTDSPEQPGPDTTPTRGDDPEPAPSPKPVDNERPAQVAQLYRSEPEPSAQVPAIQSLYNPLEPEPEPAPEPEPELEPTPAISREAPERTEPPREPERASAALQSTDNILSIRALPSRVQQAIPSIYYQDHYYDGGQDSYVVLNQQEYRQGDRVINDVVLEQIAEDGIVLSFGENRFRLARLSSWVNL